MTTYERLPTTYHPFLAVTPVLWHCGDLCGLARIEIRTPFFIMTIGG